MTTLIKIFPRTTMAIIFGVGLIVLQIFGNLNIPSYAGGIVVGLLFADVAMDTGLIK